MTPARRLASIGLLVIVGGCGTPPDPATLPPASATLVEVGKRLGSKYAPEALARLGDRESTLVAVLTRAERASLGRAYLRFRVDRPVVVDVAIPDGPSPFWLAELGFKEQANTLKGFRRWSRAYPAGTVGLGVNSLDRRSKGHYTVFVRGESGIPTIDRVEPPGCHVAPAALGPFADDARPFDSLPADLASAFVVQPRSDWRDASALVKGRVWKTRLPSTPAPDQVVVSLGADPARGFAWTWRTDPTVGPTRLRIERADGAWSTSVESRPVAVESVGLLNDPVIHRHRASVAGLEPDTAYRYAIGGSDEWHSIRTAPASDRDYAFLSMGDPQCGLEEWGKLLKVARTRRPDAGVLLIAGDLVDRGNERSNWDHFFQRAAGVFEGLPVMPAVGNHEYLDRGPEVFSSAFVLPENGPGDESSRLVYKFEYSDCFIAVLDSNPAVYSPEAARRQADWLDRGVVDDPKARWKIVTFHHPVYASHTCPESSLSLPTPGCRSSTSTRSTWSFRGTITPI